jgi:hypothetical protein
MEGAYHKRITAGFALEGDALFFAAGPRVVRCAL